MTVCFVLNGARHEAAGARSSVTLLDYLRERLHLTGTKEGCGEGDCGACTVVRVRDADGTPRFEAINACLVQLGQVDGSEILTVEGLAAANGGSLSPVQEAMASGDGTQCGFCTPGFIGALFALGQSGEAIDEATIHDALAGNLCRCTGYRPIVDAARTACTTPVPYAPAPPPPRTADHADGGTRFLAPATLAELVALRADHPDAMLLAGGTDLGLAVSKDRERPATVIHTAHVAELCEIAETDREIVLGAAVTYTGALPFIERLYPSFATLIRRLGSRQIRNLGTIGGNVGNASPIGDTPPCLIALDATLTLASTGGERELPVGEFFLDYRRTGLRPGEVIRSIRIPKLAHGQAFRTYKVSKRYDQDISAVIGAYRLDLEGARVAGARIAYGGMAAAPVRVPDTEAALSGAALGEPAFRAAADVLAGELSPISDHRASAAYRSRVAGNLLVRLCRDLAGSERELEVAGL